MSRISMFVVTQIFTWVALGQAGIVQILEPNDSYRAATTKIEISALEFNSQHEFITDGTLRVTFSFQMLKRGPVPTGWTTQAQLVYFGVKGGVPLTDVVGGTSAATSEASRYTGDPMFELRLPASFAFEADALYKRTGYNASQIGSGITSTGQVRANSWEFPMLVKYYLPFVHGGYVSQHLSGIKASVHIFGTSPGFGIPIDTTMSADASTVLHENPTHGIAAGAGLRLGAGRLHLAPEVRYTRWGGRPFDDQGPDRFFLQSSQNQVELLVGLSF